MPKKKGWVAKDKKRSKAEEKAPEKRDTPGWKKSGKKSPLYDHPRSK